MKRATWRDSLTDWAWILLGNPGIKFENTRHNLGRRLGKLLIERLGLSWTLHPAGLQAQGLVTVQEKEIRLRVLQPRTFMNESGHPVSQWTTYFKLLPSHLVVFHDDLELAPLTWKLEFGGPTRGHNGLRSLEKHLRTNQFWRLRLGIGRPSHEPVSDFVLRPLKAQDWEYWCLELPHIQSGLEKIAFTKRG